MVKNLLEKLPFYNKTWFQFILFVLHRFREDQCQERAASLTYTTLFAVVPMLTVFLVVISSIKALEPARQELQQLLYSNFLPKTTIAFDTILNSFTEKSSNLTLIGIVFLFVTSILMLTNIESAFNKIWRIKRARGGILGFMRYWTIISLSPFLLGTAFIVSSTLASLSILSQNFTGYELNDAFVLWLISFVLTIFGFSMLYWTIPNRAVPIKSAFVAGIFTTVIFETLKSFFGILMTNFTSYEFVYGAFAAIPIFLLWIYLTWNVVLLGVQISYAMTSFQGKDHPKRHPLLIVLDLLNLLYEKQKNGESLSETEALKALGRNEVGHLPIYILLLEEQHLIRRTDDNQLVLIRNLSRIDFWSFYQALPYTLPQRSDLSYTTLEQEQWLSRLAPLLMDSDDYLAAKLSIPLSNFFEKD